MNPAFVILVLLGAVVIWFLLSFVFIPLGKFVHRIYKDAINQMEQDNNKQQKNEREDK